VILLSSILSDQVTELMAARLTDMGLPFALLDLRDLPAGGKLTWRRDGAAVYGQLDVGGRTLRVEEISGVFARYVSWKSERPGLRDDDAAAADCEMQYSVMTLLDTLRVPVLTRPSACISNDSKIYQQAVIRRSGFCTPRTLATTCPAAVRDFYDACAGNVIFKSTSGTRSIVTKLDKRQMTRLRHVTTCPSVFQEYVYGIDLRVHVVGTSLFVTEIASDATDYRYAQQTGSSAVLRKSKLPDDVAAGCLKLAQAFGLLLAGIDLRRSPEGRFYCFEVNPTPGFLFYERATGQPVSEAIAQFLAGNLEFSGQH
jgi:glutathione synthase/RimK-type ligase-like ATP-grasp enzyme